HPVADPKMAATAIAGTSTPIVQPALERYDMISAFIVDGLSNRAGDMEREQTGLVDMVTSFPNGDAAERAATEMDATDFAVNPDNQRATIPGYPTAKAHYRPGNPSIAATMAVGRLVISIVTSPEQANLDGMTRWVQKIFDAQTPLMRQVGPHLVIELT